MADKIYCFEPIIFKDSKVLVLGTLPGGKSLETGFYYADKSNYFWKFLSYYAGTPLPEMIQDKVELLKLTKVAIWDVYASGYREKSSEDKNIKEGILNDIPKFLKENSNIKRIRVSGEKAYEAVKQEFPTLEITYLPSTSGTNNKQWSMGDKTRKGWVEWRKFIES